MIGASVTACQTVPLGLGGGQVQPTVDPKGDTPSGIASHVPSERVKKEPYLAFLKRTFLASGAFLCRNPCQVPNEGLPYLSMNKTRSPST
jgi:hypothetical protein